MVRERHEWESRAPLAQKIKDASREIDTETSSATPPTPENPKERGRDLEQTHDEGREKKTTPEQAV